MPPISHSETPFLQVLNLLNMDKVIDLSDISPTMQFLLDRHDKIAIDNSMIFFLDPYTLRNYDDSVKYCESLNMNIALPRNKLQNDLIAKLMRKWNRMITTPKFDSIEAWIDVGLSDPERIGKVKARKFGRVKVRVRVGDHAVIC